MSKSVLCLVLAFLAGLVGCSYHREKEQNLQGFQKTEEVGVVGQVTYQQVASQLFGAYCVKCHHSNSAKAGVDLSSYESIMSLDGLAVPGDAAGSWVYQIIEAVEMPPTGAQVPAEVLESLGKWIDAGALNN